MADVPVDRPLKREKARRTASTVIFSRDGLVLAGRRSERKRRGVGGWQFVQGGMEAGEDVLTATLREIHEEVGLLAADLVLVHSDERPIIRGDPSNPKQLLWFSLFYWPGGDISRCKLDFEAVPEFAEVMLFSWSEFDKLSVDFKREIYAQVRASYEPLMMAYLAKLQLQPKV